MAKNSKATAAAAAAATNGAPVNFVLLAELGQAGDTGKYVAEDVVNALVSAGYVMVNDQYRQPPNLIATYITDAGRTALADSRGSSSAPVAQAAPATQEVNVTNTQNAPSAGTGSDFEIETGYDLPASKRGGNGGGRTSKYPFDKLEVGQSFFIPKSAEHPEPWKTLASTVATATQRYAKGTGEFETKKVRAAQKDAAGNTVKGADGKIVYDTTSQSVEKKTFERRFIIREGVSKTGEVGARVFRKE